MQETDADLSAIVEEFMVGLACLGQLEDMRQIDELDISVSQARILFLLETATQPLPIHVLAEQAHLSMAAAGRNIDHLVRVGMLSRQESPVDRRVKLIAPTEHGRQLIALHLNSRQEAIARFVERLPKPQRSALHEALQGVLRSGALSANASHDTSTTLIGASS